MPRISKKKVRKVTEGTRLRVTVNGLKWNGVEVPRGTVGTVYVHPRPNGSTWRCIAFDGMEKLQANGLPYSIGGDGKQTYVPHWAEVVEGQS